MVNKIFLFTGHTTLFFYFFANVIFQKATDHLEIFCIKLVLFLKCVNFFKNSLIDNVSEGPKRFTQYHPRHNSQCRDCLRFDFKDESRMFWGCLDVSSCQLFKCCSAR